MPGNRDQFGRFIKGNSGNKTGRPKTPQAFKDLAKEKSLAALQSVIAIVEDPGSDPKDVISGARLIIEYAHGKPTQDVNAALSLAEDYTLEITGEVNADADDSP